MYVFEGCPIWIFCMTPCYLTRGTWVFARGLTLQYYSLTLVHNFIEKLLSFFINRLPQVTVYIWSVVQELFLNILHTWNEWSNVWKILTYGSELFSICDVHTHTKVNLLASCVSLWWVILGKTSVPKPCPSHVLVKSTRELQHTDVFYTGFVIFCAQLHRFHLHFSLFCVLLYLQSLSISLYSVFYCIYRFHLHVFLFCFTVFTYPLHLSLFCVLLYLQILSISLSSVFYRIYRSSPSLSILCFHCTSLQWFCYFEDQVYSIWLPVPMYVCVD